MKIFSAEKLARLILCQEEYAAPRDVEIDRLQAGTGLFGEPVFVSIFQQQAKLARTTLRDINFAVLDLRQCGFTEMQIVTLLDLTEKAMQLEKSRCGN